MERNGQLYNSQAGGEMPTMHTHYIDDVLTQLITYLVQLFPA
jgi:hypothetical protein